MDEEQTAKQKALNGVIQEFAIENANMRMVIAQLKEILKETMEELETLKETNEPVEPEKE